MARILGGVVLMQGNLGHQVLGQLLVMNTNEVALAGAAVVLAGATRERNAVAQIALRTAAPALAARFIIAKQSERLDRQLELLTEKERRLSTRTKTLDARETDLNARRADLAIEVQ